MASKQFTITLTPELGEALKRLTVRRGEERSRLIETLLRENPYVGKVIEEIRELPQLKKGRDPASMRRLLRAARRNMDRMLASGEVTWPE